MIQPLGMLVYELASEALIASAILWVAIILVVRLHRGGDANWQSSLFLLPVLLPIPLVLLVHLLLRPGLLWFSRTPLEDFLESVSASLPWLPPVVLGITAAALLLWGARVLRLLGTLHRQRQLWRRQRRAQSPSWRRCDSISQAVARRLQMPPVRVILAKCKSSGSLALGPLGSYVLVSSRLAPLLDDEEVEGLLAHELAHVRRRDTLLDAIADLCRYLLGFSPFAQHAYQRFIQAREEAVDLLAVRTSNDPLALASCLVKACRLSQGPTCCATDNRLLGPVSAVERRIHKLVDRPAIAPDVSPRHRRAFFGIIAATVVFTLVAL